MNKVISNIVRKYFNKVDENYLVESSECKLYPLNERGKLHDVVIQWSAPKTWCTYKSHSDVSKKGVYWITGKNHEGMNVVYIGKATDSFQKRFEKHDSAHKEMKDEFLEDIITDIKVRYGELLYNADLDDVTMISSVEVALIRIAREQKHVKLVNKVLYNQCKFFMTVRIKNVAGISELPQQFCSQLRPDDVE